MTQTKVTELTVDEFRGIIKEVVVQTLSEMLGDPDEGLELCAEAEDQLRRSLAAMKAGTRGTSLQEVVDRLGLEA